ncbi:uncharacterized protein LOC105696851 isoform X1 [Orussus abietinus]|uniref:uncharacterized protein LOC105696851 isoform X1 n=1 Tax=Orussus abietinus TaxID=222816 RepID=UPI0006251118|nr:uncharacterized protein LOC105696851 isoform X1 [Orussus abietinus]
MAVQRVLLGFFLALGLSGGLALDLNFGDIFEILKIGRETASDLLESWELIAPKRPDDTSEFDFPFVRRMEQRITTRVKLLSVKIDAFENRLGQTMEQKAKELLYQIPQEIRLYDSLNKLSLYVGSIDGKYQRMVRYSSVLSKMENTTLLGFANGAIPDVWTQPDELHLLVVPQHLILQDGSLFSQLADTMEEGTFRICNQQQSPQELLYTMYNTIALTETKALAVVQFSYNILRLFKQGNFTEEMKVQKEAYESRMYQTLRAVRTAMAHAPRDLWRCDPAEHKPESTYTELKQVFQSYVINEVDMNRDKTCRESCGFYNYAKVEGCYENQFCSRQRRCNGRLINCQYVDSDMWICPSERNSDRRYEYIEYENGRVLGKKDTCTRETVKVDSWWRWLFWHCSYCICSCDDHNASSDRYFSLQAVVSDFANNKVITGIRLRKKNHIVYMQIKEGVLLPRGGINDSTTAWREIEEFSILDPDLVEGVDYYTLGWNQTEVDLDDVVGPSNHVLIGVKFRKLGSHLNLEVLTTPFNFTTGKLIRPHDNKLWHSNENTDNSDESKRSFLDIRKPDVPTQHNARSEPDSTHNQYLKFKTTDLDKDAGQTTVPFLDVQPIVPNPLVPLSGAGIFHKGSPGSGGFLALKIITYNFADHLHVDFAPSPVLDRNNEIGEIRVF